MSKLSITSLNGTFSSTDDDLVEKISVMIIENHSLTVPEVAYKKGISLRSFHQNLCELKYTLLIQN